MHADPDLRPVAPAGIIEPLWCMAVEGCLRPAGGIAPPDQPAGHPEDPGQPGPVAGKGFQRKAGPLAETGQPDAVARQTFRLQRRYGIAQGGKAGGDERLHPGLGRQEAGGPPALARCLGGDGGNVRQGGMSQQAQNVCRRAAAPVGQHDAGAGAVCQGAGALHQATFRGGRIWVIRSRIASYFAGSFSA